MAHKKDDPKLIAFANWLPGQLTQVDKTLIQTMVSVSGLGRWTVFEAAIKKNLENPDGKTMMKMTE